MTVPHPLQLFSPVWYEPVNTATQVDRMPGVNAPCLCNEEGGYPSYLPCEWPFCGWKEKP